MERFSCQTDEMGKEMISQTFHGRIMQRDAKRGPGNKGHIASAFIGTHIEDHIKMLAAECPDEQKRTSYGRGYALPLSRNLERFHGRIDRGQQRADFIPEQDGQLCLRPGLANHPKGRKHPDNIAYIAKLDNQNTAGAERFFKIIGNHHAI
jgi:hypothetical protein